MQLKSKVLLLLLSCAFSWPQANATQHENATRQGKLVYNHRFAPHEGLVNKTEKEFRNEICLNGYWDFQPVALPKSYKYGKGIAPELPMPTEGAWSDVKIKIPSPWNINAFPINKIDNQVLPGPDHRNYPSYPKSWEKA